jgi:hypothetical protein
MSQRAKHLALDGSLVTVDSTDSHDLGAAVSSAGVYWVDGMAREFTASYREFGRAVAADLGMNLDESYSLQGGTLLLGSATQVWPEVNDAGAHITSLLRLGVWEGDWFSLHAHLYGGQSLDLVDLFNRFVISESPLGIRIEPQSPSAETHFKEPSLLKEVPGIGLLDVEALTTRVARALPRWKGTEVRGGELFTDQAEGRSRYYVLVSDSARTLVMPPSDCDHSTVVAGLETLHVSWRRPEP